MSVTVERLGRAALVAVERPDVLNALDVGHAQALEATLAELASDRGVRAVVLTGAGERAFIAGADIATMRDLSPEEGLAWTRLGQRCAELLETMPKATVAAVNGFALGGGLELALACDLRIAAATAKVGLPEVNLGIVPGWGGTQRLARATSLAYARELVLTGRLVGAEEALARGLVHEVVAPEALRERALERAEELAAKSSAAIAAAKEALNLALQGDRKANLDAEARLCAHLFGTPDQREGMAAFLEKREPRFGSD